MTYRDKGTLWVSHGIDEETLANVIMPPEPLYYYTDVCKARMDDTGEYYIEINKSKN